MRMCRSFSPFSNDRAVMGPAAGAVPFGDIFIGPLIGLIDVAAITGIGDAQFDAEIRPRYPEAMVCAVIDHHISSFRHMALDTFGPGAYIK